MDVENISGIVYGLYCKCYGCAQSAEKIRYVGVTVVGTAHRLRAHLNEARSGSEKAKDRWIRKHGTQNIRIRLLQDDIQSVEDLRASEVSWIEKLETFKSPEGLNMTRGGGGIWGYTFSDELRALFRKRTADQMSVQHPRAKVSDEDVREIIRRIWSGERDSQISADYPLSVTSIQKIRSGKNWPHIERPPTPPPRSTIRGSNSRIPPTTVDAILSEYTAEWGELKRLATKYGISEGSVSKILKRWRTDKLDRDD